MRLKFFKACKRLTLAWEALTTASLALRSASFSSTACEDTKFVACNDCQRLAVFSDIAALAWVLANSALAWRICWSKSGVSISAST